MMAGCDAIRGFVESDNQYQELLQDATEPDVDDGSPVGKTAPDFALTDSTGHEMRFSDINGKPKVLNFWASWCPPCREEMGAFQEEYTKNGDAVDFIMINIGTQGDTLDTAKSFLAENSYTFEPFLDHAGEGAGAYRVTGVPTTVIIDGDGIIAAYYIGAINSETLHAELVSVLR